MTGINKITEKILSEANYKAHEIIEEARKKCIDISNFYAEKAEEYKKNAQEKVEKDAESIISGAKSTVEVNKRNSIMEVKNDLIDEAFRMARREIDSLPEDKLLFILVGFTTKAIAEIVETQRENYALYGEEPDCEEYEIVLSEEDLKKYGKKIQKEVEEKIKDTKIENFVKSISLSKKTAKIDGGVIVRCGSIENNCSFDLIFESLREKLEGEIADYIFGNEN